MNKMKNKSDFLKEMEEFDKKNDQFWIKKYPKMSYDSKVSY